MKEALDIQVKGIVQGVGFRPLSTVWRRNT